MEKIVYLGKMEWNHAIDKGLELGLFVPNASLMGDLMEAKEVQNITALPLSILTSTTKMFDTSECLSPTKKVHKEQIIPADNARPKKMKRHAFAVSKGLEKHHIKLGLYTFENLTEA
jgi:hypothetical protein